MKQFLFCLTISLYGSILAVGQTTGTLTSHKIQSGGIERSYNTISRPISHQALLLSLYFMAMEAQPIQKDSV